MGSNWTTLAPAVMILKGTSALKVTSLNWDLAKGGWGLEFTGRQTFHLWWLWRVRRIRPLRISIKLLLFKSLLLIKFSAILLGISSNGLRDMFLQDISGFQRLAFKEPARDHNFWFELETLEWKNNIPVKVLSCLVLLFFPFLYYFPWDDSIEQCN